MIGRLLNSYSFSQWILLFYVYCFIGWIWESCYVSVKKRQWVNRGFLHGPFLPIYGSGALVILMSTIGVRNNVPLIFILGMISSTILEFFTGYFMEKLFGVKYWDYSDRRFNFMGHICLFVSICWGFFSVLLVCFINKPIENLILLIPKSVTEVIALIITVVFSIDFTQSFNEAMDLKTTLKNITYNNEQIKTFKRRLEIRETFFEEDISKILKRGSKDFKHISSIIKRNPDAISKRAPEAMKALKEMLRKNP
ncbi:MAG: putative ABC transporter permease [Lachnospira sp.]